MYTVYYIVFYVHCNAALTATDNAYVMLSSSLDSNRIAYNQQEVFFNCTAWGSNILEWNSAEYIGQGGFPLQLLSFNGTETNVSSTTRPSTYAVRLSVATENGQAVIMSELRIIASVQYPVATVTCGASGAGSSIRITFQTIGKIPVMSLQTQGG